MAEKSWYLNAAGGEPIGPVSLDLLIRGSDLGKIPFDAVVCSEAEWRWSRLRDLPEFKEAKAAARSVIVQDEQTVVRAEKQWFVGVSENEPVGPVTMDQLVRGSIAGKIPRDALVCPEGGTTWVPLRQLPEFRESVQQAEAELEDTDPRQWKVRWPEGAEMGPMPTRSVLIGIRMGAIPRRVSVHEALAVTWIAITSIPDFGRAFPPLQEPPPPAVRPAPTDLRSWLRSAPQGVIPGAIAVFLAFFVGAAAITAARMLQGNDSHSPAGDCPPAH